MSTATTERISALSGDLAPFIGAAGVSVVLGKLGAVSLTRQGKSDLETGTITLEVLEIFHGERLAPGQLLEVPMQRLADEVLRERSGFDHWNTVKVATGALWLLAGRAGVTPNRLIALAAVEVASPDAVQVVALRQCYVIERLSIQDPRKPELLQSGLSASDTLVRRYALDVLGRRALYPRTQGVELIARAIDSPLTSADDKLTLGEYLTRQYFFDGERRQDSANQQVVTTLAAALVHETNFARRTQWANLLASCVLSELSPRAVEDKALRLALVRGVRDPTAPQVVAVLTALLREVEAEHDERLRELLTAWRAAM